MAASTSIGAIVTACSHAAQPAVKPASAPNAKYGNRAVPPATGYADPSSAWINANTISIAAASTHDSSDAGPAVSAANSAPSSHPDPMIDPSETNISPQKPTDRFRFGDSTASRSFCVIGYLRVASRPAWTVVLLGAKATRQCVRPRSWRDGELGEFPLGENHAHRAVGVHVADRFLRPSQPRIAYPQRDADRDRFHDFRTLGQ